MHDLAYPIAVKTTIKFNHYDTLLLSKGIIFGFTIAGTMVSQAIKAPGKFRAVGLIC
jgi:hypothetical protein